MRISTFNAENLFSRASAMNLETWALGRGVLNDVAELNSLLAQETYDGATSSKIKTILERYGFQNPNKRNRPFEIVQVRGKLFSIKKGTKEIKVNASNRSDWVGWVELARDDIIGAAVDNTGKVISEVKADIQCLIEVENRTTLDRFNKQLLSRYLNVAFEHNMLVDGNDQRGIDIGLLSRYPIVSVRSHIDAGGAKPIFSRDCPEYEIAMPHGSSLWILGNHLKSKGYGKPKESDEKRKKQAEEVARIYAEARTRSDHVIVAGDFNDSPDREPLQPVLTGTDLKDVMTHQSFAGSPGTYGTCASIKQKIDYILLSPALWAKVLSVGTERRGIYAPRAGKPFETVTSAETSASDHAAVWVDLEI